MRMSRYNEDRYEERGGGRGGVAIFLAAVVLVALFCVLGIGVGNVGSFLSEKVVTPVAAWLSGGSDKNAPHAAEGSPAPSAVQSGAASAVPLLQRALVIPGVEIYALQSGTFSNVLNAQAQADSLMQKGGAGYIWEDEGSYRVLLSAYASKSEAQSVQSRLKDEQQMETRLLAISGKRVEFTARGDEDTVSGIEEACAFLDGLTERLMALSLAVDKGETRPAAALEELAKLAGEAEARKKRIDEIAQSTDNSIVKHLDTFFTELQPNFAKLQPELSDIECSVRIKQLYLSAGIHLAQLASDASPDANNT